MLKELRERLVGGGMFRAKIEFSLGDSFSHYEAIHYVSLHEYVFLSVEMEMVGSAISNSDSEETDYCWSLQ
jgi:hypothetical protein